jgi:lipopolysaccharide transport system ATP-binding protein
MSDIAIRVENLGKLYRLGPRERYRTLRDTLADAACSPLRFLSSAARRDSDARDDQKEKYIWALKQVSFEIGRGDVVGIIGRNGAGKSTLLKILSRITEPTEGVVKIKGRVGSLLEVGTGFHPELTGRENIYLNGTILGMRRAEIARKFDEIVAFAEIEEFIDTPVKRYSSGMYMRLAFAVAAHLEPEILLVDEVLAVGDAAFQNKCLGKMSDVARQGRTVLFVSHNMGAITQLCPKAILLQSGRVELFDQSDRVVARYLVDAVSARSDVRFDPQANSSSPAILTRFWVADPNGNPVAQANVTREFCIGLAILARRDVGNVDISVRFRNALGQPIFTTNLSDSTQGLSSLKEGEHSFLIQIPGHLLAPDTYSLIVAIHRPGVEMFDLHDSGLVFQVSESGSRMWQYHGQAYGNVLVQLPWRLTDAPG